MSQPEPDIALLRPQADFSEDAVPGPEGILFILEIADSSVGYDRDRTLPLYAAAGSAAVWLVDRRWRWVMVYRDLPPRECQMSIQHPRSSTLRPFAFPDLELSRTDCFGSTGPAPAP